MRGRRWSRRCCSGAGWQKRKLNVVLPPPVPAHVRAKQKLEEALALISQPKPFVIAVSDTARIYLEERFDFRAPERTTEEFLRELDGTELLLPEQKESLGNFLESCDLVKFAKYEPGENELRGVARLGGAAGGGNGAAEKSERGKREQRETRRRRNRKS